MPIKARVFLSSDNRDRLVDCIENDKPVTLYFTSAELEQCEDPTHQLTPLLLMPQQAKALADARLNKADLQMKFTPGMTRLQTTQQDGGGILDFLKGIGKSVLKGAANGALNAAVQHVQGMAGGADELGGAVSSRLVKVRLSDAQKRKIAAAHHNKGDIGLRISRENMDGPDAIPLGEREAQRFEKARYQNKGVVVQVHHEHIAEHAGGGLSDLIKNFLPVGLELLTSLI